MNTFLWIISGLGAAIAVAALIEAYVKRNRKRSLVDMRPDPAKLKRRPWEADGVAKVHTGTAADKVQEAHEENQKTEEDNGRLNRAMRR